MKAQKLLADISRDFLKKNNIYQYHMKKIANMDDREVISCCHRFCEANHLTNEWKAFRKSEESKYRYCIYLEEFIEDGLCYDLQMITEGCIKASALPDITIDKEKCAKCCFQCNYRI